MAWETMRELSLFCWIERRLKNDFITLYKYTHQADILCWSALQCRRQTRLDSLMDGSQSYIKKEKGEGSSKKGTSFNGNLIAIS